MDQATGRRRARIAPNGHDHPVDDLIDDLAGDLDPDYEAQEFDDLPEQLARAKALLEGLRKKGKRVKPGEFLTAEAIAAAALLYACDLPAFADLKSFLRPHRILREWEPAVKAAAKMVGETVESGDRRTEYDAAIEEMNARHFVVVMGGKVVVCQLEPDEVLRRERLVVSRDRDIILFYRNRLVVVGVRPDGSAIVKSLGVAWLDEPRRRTYRRIAVIPRGECPPDVFNMWRGFGVGARPGDWATIRYHLLEVICAGDHGHYEWLIRWIARGLQFPEQQGEVIVALRGREGSGKGSLGRMLLRIFHSHAVHILQARHFTGHFNARLAGALFVFLDEALWAGDKQGEGVLKGIVTEPTIEIEPKGVDPFTMPNQMKILMATNHDWAVPAGPDARRYFVLDVAGGRIGDFEYFSRLNAAIDGDELAAFLHDLLNLDLSGFNHRTAPNTDALAEQKTRSANSFNKFWLDCLHEGEIVGVPEEGWPESIATQLLHVAYRDHTNERYPLTIEGMAKELRKLLPDLELKRHRPRRSSGERPWGYRLPWLHECRAAYLRAMKIERYDWECEE